MSINDSTVMVNQIPVGVVCNAAKASLSATTRVSISREFLVMITLPVPVRNWGSSDLRQAKSVPVSEDLRHGYNPRLKDDKRQSSE